MLVSFGLSVLQFEFFFKGDPIVFPQTNGIGGEQRLYKGTLDCVRQIFVREVGDVRSKGWMCFGVGAIRDSCKRAQICFVF